MITKSYLSLIRGFVTSLSCLALGGLLLVSCETKGAGGAILPSVPTRSKLLIVRSSPSGFGWQSLLLELGGL